MRGFCCFLFSLIEISSTRFAKQAAVWKHMPAQDTAVLSIQNLEKNNLNVLILHKKAHLNSQQDFDMPSI